MVPAERHRDLIRLALQSAAAGAATYALMRLADLPDMSWAVISALFVLQLTPDSTLATAGGRLLGTVIGTALGLGLTALIPAEMIGGWGILVRLALSGLVMSAISVIWPGLRYGVVAAAIIVLGPGEQGIFEGAVDRGAAIVIGTVLGTVAALAVWPDPAQRRLRRHLRRALKACADMARTALDGIVAEGEGEGLNAVQGRVLSALSDAREAAAASRLHRLAGHRHPVKPTELVFVVERIWYDLVFLDRVDRDGRYRLGLDGEARDALRLFQNHACSMLSTLADGLGKHGTARPQAQVEDAIASIDRALTSRRQPGPDSVRAHALVFGLSELSKDLDKLLHLLEGRGEPDAR